MGKFWLWNEIGCNTRTQSDQKFYGSRQEEKAEGDRIDGLWFSGEFKSDEQELLELILNTQDRESIAESMPQDL